MKKIKIQIKYYLAIAISTILIASCSLDENNPSSATIEEIAASSVSGYQSLINNCYFGWERKMYGNTLWMMLCEAGTDLWTYQKNASSYSQFFKYGAGSTFTLDLANDQWNVGYDGIGYCNLAIKYADIAPFDTDSARNTMVAEAHFLRAMYYYNLVEQFGGVTLITEPSDVVNYHPERTEPLEIYKQVIIPDLIFASKWLPVSNEETRPSKKSALGYLARAYLQTVEYDDTKQYADSALEISQLLISDCESGGSNYNTYMYSTFEEVFKESNNTKNKEALWSHRFVQGGTSNSAYVLNTNNELFYASVTGFSARIQELTSWGGRSGGYFMPSSFLLNEFIQEDGSLDPRYHQSFQTMWLCNKAYSWKSKGNADTLTYDRASTFSSSNSLAVGDTAIFFIHTNDNNYSSRVAKKHDQKYLLIDMNDVYKDTVRMKYTRSIDGKTVTNPFFGFYPSLTKHNSSNYFAYNSTKYGNLDATFMMRMAEIYLIAAEADIYVNGGANALKYINKIRQRAGANDLPSTLTPTVQTVLDERARELCGEYVRYYDLKRTGKLTHDYLSSSNYDVGQYFNDNIHKVRPIPISFLQTLQDGGAYYQNPGY